MSELRGWSPEYPQYPKYLGDPPHLVLVLGLALAGGRHHQGEAERDEVRQDPKQVNNVHTGFQKPATGAHHSRENLQYSTLILAFVVW